ncbi:MAG: SIR2 family protein, partial [Lachnospiraceae bacterium]
MRKRYMSKSFCNKLIKESQSKIVHFLESFSRCIINEEASLFMGTGVSMNSGLPSWHKLLEPCIQQLGLTNENALNLYKVAQYYENSYTKASLREIVHEQINAYYDKNPIIQALLSLNFKSVWTTNYDTLIEKELEALRIPYNAITNEKNLSQISTHDKINLYKINGDISDPDNIVLTQTDYEGYENTHSLFLTFLKKELVSNTFLFIGYSFEDQVILNCLSSTMHLLNGSGNLHYAFIYIDEKTTPQIEYKVQDLRLRYNIECLYVNKDTLPELITLLNEKVKEKKVFISGAYYDVLPQTDLFADNLSKALVTALLDNDNRISTGIGRRLGTYITGYANQYLAEKQKRNPQKYLSMRPFPFHLELTDAQKEEYRTYMMRDCKSAIFMFGQSEHTMINGGFSQTNHYSHGVYQEFMLAQKHGLIIIPVGSTGYEAEVIWQEVKNNINKYYYLSKKIDVLKTETNPERLSKIIVSILNQDKK